MKKQILLCAAIISMLTACQKVVDADELLNTTEQVLITSFISPQDTVLRVSVTKALPAIGTPLSVQDSEANAAKFLITNARVTISDEAGNSTNLSYSEENKTYLAAASTLTIASNQNYFLNVTVDDQTYTATCSIPSKISEISEKINFKNNNFGGQEVDINLTFQDIAGEDNFYVLGGEVTTTIQYEGQEPETYTFRLSFDSDEFLQDNLTDGDLLSGNAIEYVGDQTNVLATTIRLQVANVEEILMQNLRTASTNSDADGNPFVEYAIAPNNINEKGAVGIFAGYQITEKVITLEL